MSDFLTAEKKNPLREIVQPFIDLVHAPRALWGINAGYLIEGFAYFGILTYLAMYFNEYIGLNDIWAGWMVGCLTAGITISMFFFGGLADRWGVRIALIAAFCLLLAGRVLVPLGPALGFGPSGLWSPAFFLAMGGILLIVLGYGMYQPAAYAAVRQFTTEKTAAMGYAMLYALMNLGGFLPSFFSPVRKALGIAGAFWVYAAFTLLALFLTAVLLTRRTVLDTLDTLCAERESAPAERTSVVPVSNGASSTLVVETPSKPSSTVDRVIHWFTHHPLADAKFSFFIFALIPVQTLFAHNWLTLPQYVERAYAGTWIGEKFEVATNFNPLLIFVLVPIVTAMTQKRNVYNIMIVGTLVMAAPTFLLAIGPNFWTLAAYIVIMSIGEAMWQPRFLQYAAEIAPEGRTGAYMGVAQFPWFLTKMIVPLYSGWFLSRYCPKEGVLQTETMWLIYGVIAVSSTIMLILARNWLGKDFKTKAV